ncbi:hamartin-like [Anguilla rostrata]|uniref:hamartin-like n=1 Tax=Anguilla rostrata TaxID=7938 RepID=UPI0030D435E0
MARDQPNVGDLLPLLESSDLRQLDQVKALITEQLSADRGSVLLNGLVDYYLETSSSQALQILTSVREPHDKHLLDKLNECLSKPASRLPTLTLLGHVVRKQPSWIHKITRFPLLASLLKCLKTDSDVVVLITGVLVLITLLPMIPQAGRHYLYEFFDVFGRLAAWNLRNQGHVTEVFLIHLHASVYSLFHRLYGMYPCNFISYLRSHYNMKENMDAFQEVVKPMLEHVRIHPELVTGNKDHELDPTRWKKFEIHDIVIECAKVSLDPKEASCEEGYSALPDHGPTPLQPRPPDTAPNRDTAPSPYADLQSSYGSSSSTSYCDPRQTLPPLMPPLSGTHPPHDSPHIPQRQTQILSCDVTSSGVTNDPIWSPSSICGMATPPSSRGISPTNASELSQSASHFPSHAHAMPAAGKGPPSSCTPAASSPHPSLTEERLHALLPNTASPPRRKGRRARESCKPCLKRQEPIRELERGSSADADSRGGVCEGARMNLTEVSAFVKKQEQEQQQRAETEREEAITEELLKITQDQRDVPAPPGPFYRTTETLTGAQEKPSPAPPGPRPPCPGQAPSAPDRTEEAPAALFAPIDRPAPAGRPPRSPPAPEEEGGAAAPPKYGPFSPPSPCKTPPPAYRDLFDLALPKAASLFVGRRTAEAARRAGEGRRPEEGQGEGLWEGEGFTTTESPLEVLDRLIQQGSDVHGKRSPLPSRSADWNHFGGSAPWDELQTLRSQLLLLHSQLLYERYKREQHAVRNRRLLRRIINATALQEHNNAMVTPPRQNQRQLILYTHRTQELQSKLQEYQKRIGELEAELQRANYKVCHTAHQLDQLSVKLSSGENAQQQMAFLNKQLLLLGELNRLCVEEMQHSGQDSKKEAQMLQASSLSDLEKLRQGLVHCGQGLEAAQQRVGELESQLAKKEHLIAEQKKFLEDVKGQARAELQASESRFQTQRKLTQTLQSELLQLYSRLETESPDTAPGGATESCGPHNARCVSSRPEEGSSSVLDGQVKADVQDNVDGGLSDSQRSNSSTLSPGKPQAPPTPNSVNGRREHPKPLPASPPSHLPSTPPSRLADAPLAVGSCPSEKSFLGIQARELFRNKSESRGEEGAEPVATPRLSGLSQGLKTELCVEPAGSTSPAPPSKGPAPPSKGPAPPSKSPAKEPQVAAQQRTKDRPGGGARGRGGTVGGAGQAQQRQPQQQRRLRIMDYNETHHEHS